MKILVDRNSCEITFEKQDEKYVGKILDISGQGYDKEFYIQQPLKMYWSYPLPTHPNRYIGSSLSEEEKSEVLPYVIKEAKKNGYSLFLK